MDVKKIIFIICSYALVTLLGLGAGYYFSNRSSDFRADEFRNTITDISGRNELLQEQNKGIIENNNRLREQLEYQLEYQLNRTVQAKEIIGELSESLETTGDRLSKIIITVRRIREIIQLFAEPE